MSRSENRPSVQVVIVSYNVADYLQACLAAVDAAAAHYGRERVEVWVVDNASRDASAERVRRLFSEVHLIANAENVGFARANNQAIGQSASDYVLLLNPDTLLSESALSELVAFLEANPEAGAVGPRLVDGRGRFLPESKRSLPTPWVAFYKLFGLARLFPQHRAFGSYHTRHLPYDATQSVEVLSGSCQLLRRSAYVQVGGLDNDYFMFGEDVDLSYKLLRAGHANWYLPSATVLHYKGRSSARHRLGHVWRFYQAMFRFLQKHYRPTSNPMWYALLWLGVALRALIAAVARVGLLGLELIVFIAFAIGIVEIWQRVIAHRLGGGYPPALEWFVAPGYALAFAAALRLAGAYRRPYGLRPVGWGVLGGFLAIAVISYLVPAINFSRAIVLGLTGAVGLTALATRGLLGRAGRALWRAGAGEPQPVALAGTAEGLAELQRLFPRLGARLVVKARYTGAELDTLVERTALLAPGLLLLATRDLPTERVIAWRMALAEYGIPVFTLAPEGEALIGPDRTLAPTER